MFIYLYSLDVVYQRFGSAYIKGYSCHTLHFVMVLRLLDTEDLQLP